MTSLRNALLFIVVVLTLSFTIGNKVTKSLEKSHISSGDIMPSFIFKNNANNDINLKDLKGKYIYLNLWTTWSKQSKNELSNIEQLSNEFKNIHFVNLSLDYPRDLKKWKEEIKNQNINGFQLISNNGWECDFVKTFDIIKIPRAILIDSKGKIIDINAPKASSARLKKILEGLNI